MPIQHIAEQQDGPLTGREQLQDGKEGERDTFVSAIACRRVLRRLGQPAVRERLKPCGLGPSCRDREQRIGFGSKPHRQRARLAFLERIEEDVGRDLIEPGPQRGLTLEGVAVLPGAQHRLLHQILGIMQRPQQAITVQVQFLAIWLDEGAEFGKVASCGVDLRGFRCHNFVKACLMLRVFALSHWVLARLRRAKVLSYFVENALSAFSTKYDKTGERRSREHSPAGEGEGIHAAAGGTCPAAVRAPLGEGGEAVRLRRAQRQGDASRSLWKTQPARRLSLYVQSR